MSAGVRIPADFEPHARTVMAWAVHREWGAAQADVERELDLVVRAISEDEPVLLLTPPDRLAAAKLRGFGPEVEIVPAPVDDVWMRDVAPVFAKRGKETVAIDLNFNGWDGSRPARPGDRLARTFDFGVPVIATAFVGEGGAFLADGRGLVVVTKSCLLSRNPHLDQAMITGAFARLGMHTVIWLNGDRNEPVTAGHPDGYLVFLPDGAVAVEIIKVGEGSRRRGWDVATLLDAAVAGKVNRVIPFDARPDGRSAKPEGALFAGTYLNLFVTKKTVLTAQFGDKRQDLRAEQQLRDLFPGREIRMLGLDAILRGGGGIRCLTQPVPA